MHRTQILLDQGQYLALKEVARSSRKSMGALVRDYIEAGLSAKKGHLKSKQKALKNLEGFLKSPKLAEGHHDEWLYGTERK